MKGNVMNPLFLLALWMWWTEATISYNTFLFSTKDATRLSYSTFLVAMRDELGNGNSYGIPVMRDPSKVNVSRRFRLVNLTNSDHEFVILAMDVINAYVVGYQATDRSYFFQDAPNPESDNLFPNTRRTTLPFTSTYADLETMSNANRSNTHLGMLPLRQAIKDLYQYSSTASSDEILARAFIACIQMISEATKIAYFEKQALRFFNKDYFLADCAVISLEDNLKALSYAIQNSHHGRFPSPIRLNDSNCNGYTVPQVSQALVDKLALLTFELITNGMYNPDPAGLFVEYNRSFI